MPTYPISACATNCDSCTVAAQCTTCSADFTLVGTTCSGKWMMWACAIRHNYSYQHLMRICQTVPEQYNKIHVKIQTFTKPVCEYIRDTVMKYRITGANRLRIEHYDGTCSCPVLKHT